MICMMVVCGERDDHFREVLDEAHVFFHSFLEHSTKTPRFQIYTTKNRLFEVLPLAELYPDMEFVLIDEDIFQKHGKGDARYYKLEAYRAEESQVFVFDSDIVWLKDPANLFGYSQPIAMAKEGQRDQFNSGLVCVNQHKIGARFQDLLNHKHDGGFGNDQNILNSFFRGQISHIDRKFNTLITEAQKLDEVIGLHLILKPWYESNKGRCSPELTEEILSIYRRHGGKV